VFNEESSIYGCTCVRKRGIWDYMKQVSSKAQGVLADRRSFLKLGGMSSALMLSSRAETMAGPFTRADYSPHLIPENKRLSKKWIASMKAEGNPEVYTGAQLKYIGMPVGGIGCGQLYLGGDGRLWHWDIFKSNYDREKHEMKMSAMTMGGHYPHPVEMGAEYCYQNGADVDQGFAVRVTAGDQVVKKTLDKDGFKSVSFRGEYPVGRVSYREAGFPVEVDLAAFSPFIPLNTKDSALPVTVMQFTVKNVEQTPVEVELAGWLQNAVCPYTTEASRGTRHNEYLTTADRTTLLQTISGEVDKEHGYGSSALSILASAGVNGATTVGEDLFSSLEGAPEASSADLGQKLLGALGQMITIAPGESQTVTFLVSWYFPYHQKRTTPNSQLFSTRHYRPWFKDAGEVAQYVATDQERLIGETLTWNQVWNNSTLPQWMLDRSMIPLDCMATQTFHWFENGLPWSWEGVDCCEGTCTHVFHYAQALSRLFPELESRGRELVDYDLAFKEDSGGIGYRGQDTQKVADDGQAGTILRVYREHQMSTDDAFLQRLWPKVKKSLEYLLAKDPDQDGIMTGHQENTLDAAWSGKIAWLSSMYLGALAAGEAMAVEVGETEFAQLCRRILDRGYQTIVSELYNGEYFIQTPDEETFQRFNTNDGCHIDQVLGQAWMHQVGLGRVIPKEQTVSALNSLWKYNFAPDAGGYALKHREIEEAFRWYAMEGEAGLLMTTWPRGGAEKAIPGATLRSAENPTEWTGPGGYFNECMNGFEYQVAWHMIAEGDPDSELVERGLSLMKSVHDRYGAEKRNPYNEIECSDHYGRSMASYGIFLTACGFSYHGPKGEIGFDPKIRPAQFRAPFTSAAGWGTYEQSLGKSVMDASITLAWGSLKLSKVTLTPGSLKVTKAIVKLNGAALQTQVIATGSRVDLILPDGVELQQGQTLEIVLA